MIDKEHLRQTMLNLTEAELAQNNTTYEEFLSSARLDQNEPVERDEQSQAEAAAELAAAFDDRAHEAQSKIAAIRNIDFGPKTEVAPGAVVKLGQRYLVIAVSTDSFVCQDQKFVGISPKAPIYKAIEGKVVGEVCEFGGRTLQIEEIY